MVTLIVDGYNVVHAVPELERQLDRSLEAARDALVSLCRDYRARRGDVARVTVVFDGDQAYARGLHADRGGVTVLFTGIPGTGYGNEEGKIGGGPHRPASLIRAGTVGMPQVHGNGRVGYRNCYNEIYS